VASLTDKPKQWNAKHPGGHWSKKDHENKDTARPAKCKPELGKVKSSGSIHVQMPKVIKAIIISVDSESNGEQEQESKQQPKQKQPVVEIGQDEDDEDGDDEDEDEDDEY